MIVVRNNGMGCTYRAYRAIMRNKKIRGCLKKQVRIKLTIELLGGKVEVILYQCQSIDKE